jgi:hypothetical protein
VRPLALLCTLQKTSITDEFSCRNIGTVNFRIRLSVAAYLAYLYKSVACRHGLLIDHDSSQACEISVTRVIPGNLTWMAGHFLLTNQLLENMKSACRESGVQGRIVNLSSSGHVMTYPGICFDKIHDPSG